jgi:hypothetical protein
MPLFKFISINVNTTKAVPIITTFVDCVLGKNTNIIIPKPKAYKQINKSK